MKHTNFLCALSLCYPHVCLSIHPCLLLSLNYHPIPTPGQRESPLSITLSKLLLSSEGPSGRKRTDVGPCILSATSLKQISSLSLTILIHVIWKLAPDFQRKPRVSSCTGTPIFLPPGRLAMEEKEHIHACVTWWRLLFLISLELSEKVLISGHEESQLRFYIASFCSHSSTSENVKQ